MRNSNRRFVGVGIILLTATLLALALAGPAQAQVSTPTAGEDSVYRDPAGRFALPIPTNWIAEEHDGYVTIASEDKKIAISLVVIPGMGAGDAIAQAMELIAPSADATPLPATPTSDSDTVAFFTYDDGSSSGQLVQAYGQRVGDVVFVLVLQGDLETIRLRQVQVDKIINGVQVFPDALGSPVATPAA